MLKSNGNGESSYFLGREQNKDWNSYIGIQIRHIFIAIGAVAILMEMFIAPIQVSSFLLLNISRYLLLLLNQGLSAES